MKRRMEVRCCCDPSRLLGYLEADDEVKRHLFPCRLDETLSPFVDASVASAIEALEFEVDDVTLFDRQRQTLLLGKALKSRDYPIEKLRAIPGWIDP